jgi:hypothetical protein
MTKDKPKKVRMSLYITPEMMEKVNTQSEKLGLSKSAVVSVAFQSGIKSLELASDPTWQDFFEKQFKDGKVEIPWDIVREIQAHEKKKE